MTYSTLNYGNDNSYLALHYGQLYDHKVSIIVRTISIQDSDCSYNVCTVTMYNSIQYKGHFLRCLLSREI